MKRIISGKTYNTETATLLARDDVGYANANDDEFRRQHNLTLREDGRLQLLDNGNGRGLVFSLDEVALEAVADA